MIDKQRIQQAATDYASKARVTHDRSFCDGAMWVLGELDSTCNAAADLIEKLRSENARWLELTRAQSECLCNIIKAFQEDGK